MTEAEFVNGTPCVGCGRPMLSATTWRRKPEHRAGHVKKVTRDRCGSCYDRDRRPNRPRTAKAPACGTYAAYQQHYRNSEPIDDACRHAATVYQGQWRARNGKTTNALVPYALLGELLAVAPTELEERAETILGDATVTRAIESAQTVSQ